jgi:dimethylargininase
MAAADSRPYDRTVLAKKALVRRPGPRLAEGLVTHIERSSVDADLAMTQWEGYVRAFVGAGWRVTEVEPAPECPDSVFVEDTVVVYGDLAVIARSGAAERRPETTGTEKALAELGYRIAHIEAPGMLDGGDVLKHGGTVYVGQSGRTNPDGIGQLAEHLAPFGATVAAVPLTKALHLKSAVTALPDGAVIGYEPVVDDPAVFPAFLPVPEEPGAHVVLLGDGNLLMSSSAPATASLLRARGYEPVLVDIGEFEKLEGCVTCLSVRLRGI